MGAILELTSYAATPVGMLVMSSSEQRLISLRAGFLATKLCRRV